MLCSIHLSQIKNKMKKYNLFIAITLLILGVTSCNKDDKATPTTPKGNVEIVFVPKIGNQPLVLNQGFVTPAGENFTIKDFKFYVNEVAFAMMNSTEKQVTSLSTDSSQNGVWLIDFSKPNFDAGFGTQAFKLTVQADAGEYADFRFAIKVPRAYNMADISTNPFPLNAKNGMYWSWNSGFKFLVINGTTDVGAPNTPVHLSIGLDYRSAIYNFRSMALASSREGIKVESGKTTRIVLEYDVNALLTNTDGSKYSFVAQPGKANPVQVHGGELSDKIFANSAAAVDLKEFKIIN
jgi:hypothetical protein